jgi:glycerol-3-phosphate dehydrogenase (NAD(P)+)
VERVAVVGSTSWGTVLAVLLAGNGLSVRLCAYDEADAEALHRDGENVRLQPGLRFPPSLTVTHEREVASGMRTCSLLPPSATLRRTCGRFASCQRRCWC